MRGFLKGLGAGGVVAALGLAAGSQLANPVVAPTSAVVDNSASQPVEPVLSVVPAESTVIAAVPAEPAPEPAKETVEPAPADGHAIAVPPASEPEVVAEPAAEQPAPAAVEPERPTEVTKEVVAEPVTTETTVADPLLTAPPVADATAPAPLSDLTPDLSEDEKRYAAIDENSVDPAPPEPMALAVGAENGVEPLDHPAEPPEVAIVTEAPADLANNTVQSAEIVTPTAEQSLADPVQAAQNVAPVDEDAPKAPAAPPAEPVVEPEPVKVATAPAEPAAEQAPAPTDEGPTVALAPVPKLQGAPGVVTGRLPSIGAEPSAPAAPSQTAAAPSDDPRPLVRYARAFENPDMKPYFSILLVDTGATDVDLKALASSGLPVSIVIDPLSKGAAERAAVWRAAGQEVVMQATGLPQGATPADVEQTFQQLDSMLPESVGVIDLTGSVFQGDRPLASSVVPVIGAQGRGMITLDKGLNSADQVAQREGIPSAKVFRVLDGNDEAPAVIRRYLDRAAFKAAQEGEVMVLGSLRAETVQAILEWAIEGRAATMALAPASAVLLH